MLERSNALKHIMSLSPVMPVIAIDNADEAVHLAHAFVEGGITVLEITLRTPAAVQAIHRIANEVDGVTVGAGTVLNLDDLHRVQDAGAAFAISPGMTPTLLLAATESPYPFLPGVATASDIMQGLDAGLEHFKLFPAEAAGGISLLKAFAGPFPHIRFCPTGGIHLQNFQNYLALENVLCVGGSWIAPAKLIHNRAYNEITTLCHQAVTFSS